MKTKSFIAILNSLLFICLFSFAGAVQAAGSATVSWTPPTTDQGGGALTGLSGYKVYYDTASHWASSCPAGVGSAQDVPGGATASYRFNNNLTAGQTYRFAVVAYDDASPANVSGCATGAGGVTEISKKVTYSGDINADWVVNGGDITTMAGYYLTNNSAADINKDGIVNGGDVTILAEDYLKPAL